MDINHGNMERFGACVAPNAEPNGFTTADHRETCARDAGEWRFDIYPTEAVSLTSTFFSGGDWRWNLTAPSGAVLADCGGYRSRAACLAAVEALRNEAGVAVVRIQSGSATRTPT